MLHSILQALVAVDREVAHKEQAETGLRGEEESVLVWFVSPLEKSSSPLFRLLKQTVQWLPAA